MNRITHRLIPTIDARPTSIKAAETVWHNLPTIRERVEAYFLAHPYGRTDDDLRLDVNAYYSRERLLPPPESSYRKRRTELAAENILITHGDTRKNEHGMDALVWLHRSHCLYPPPQKTRQKKPSKLDELRDYNARLIAENDMLRAQAEQAAEHERAKIVAWLRNDERGGPQLSPFAHRYAIQIERKEHLRAR